MQVKDVFNKNNLKVVDPRTGKIGFYKGDYEGGVFLGMREKAMSKIYPIEVSKEDFLEWYLADDKEKATIGELFRKV